MAPTAKVSVAGPQRRDVVVCEGLGCREVSDWYYWGRWVLAAAIVLFFAAIILAISWINARRRRRQGLRPMYGTGWMAPPPKYPGPPVGTGYYQPPAPPYPGGPAPQQPQFTGSTFAPGDGYYGNHANIEMQPQQPQNAYYPGNRAEAPPVGPIGNTSGK